MYFVVQSINIGKMTFVPTQYMILVGRVSGDIDGGDPPVSECIVVTSGAANSLRTDRDDGRRATGTATCARSQVRRDQILIAVVSGVGRLVYKMKERRNYDFCCCKKFAFVASSFLDRVNDSGRPTFISANDNSVKSHIC